MNVLQRLFKREAPVEATTTDDVLGELAADEQRRLAEQAAQIAKERRETAEYRARVIADAAELRGRLHDSLDELADLVPRLLLACGHFNTVAAEVQVKGLGFDPGASLLEDVFGIPPDFGVRLAASIREIAPRTEWDWGHTGPLANGRKAERPKIREPQALRVPRFAGDTAPPRGYSGRWDLGKGEPIE